MLMLSLINVTWAERNVSILLPLTSSAQNIKSKNLGEKILLEAIQEPYNVVLNNAGLSIAKEKLEWKPKIELRDEDQTDRAAS